MHSQPSGRLVVGRGGNVLKIGPNAVIAADIEILGRGCLVEVGARCILSGAILIHPGITGVIRIGPETTATGATFEMHEDGEIVVGRDCMFSHDVQLHVSDAHPIFDRRYGRRINPARPIRIGDHVWLGARALILKGARIGDGAVIGAASLVRGSLPAGVIAAGAPARIKRRNVSWRRTMVGSIPPEPPVSWLRRLQRVLSRRRFSAGRQPRPGAARFTLDQLGHVASPLDQPKICVRADDPLVFEGFAFDHERGVAAAGVEVVLDGRRLETVYGELRSDVAAHFRNPKVEACGFHLSVPGALVRPGRHCFSLRVILADGEAFDESVPIWFEAAGAFQEPLAA